MYVAMYVHMYAHNYVCTTLQDTRQAVIAYRKVGTTAALRKAFIIQKEYDIDGAISTCLMDGTGRLLPVALETAINADPSKSESFISDIALKTANYYIQDNKPGLALEAANSIAVNERINFYRANNFITEYINLLQSTRRLKELYHFLKGCNKIEEGVNIAKKFNDTDNHIIFVLMTIKFKLSQNDNYTKEAQQVDAKQLLNLLSEKACSHLQQQLLYYIALLEGRKDWYNIYKSLNDRYFKIKAFDSYVRMFENDLNVSAIFKNLRQLLHLHNAKLDETMIKVFDVSQKEEKYYISPLMLQDLCDSNITEYKKDRDGMFVLNKSQLKRLFSSHTKSFAINWLNIIDEVLGYDEEQQYAKFSGHVKVHDIINVMYYYTDAIEHKYYYDEFKIKCPARINSNISRKLVNLLNFSWICYIPFTHNSVKALIENRAVHSAFVKLGIRNSTAFTKKWVFRQYGSQTIINFIKFAEETVNAYVSVIKRLNVRMIDLSPVISELEIITIGLLGIFSEVDREHKIVIPQSYEIATGFFNAINFYHLFSLLSDSEKEYGKILQLFHTIIKFLLGNADFNSMLSMAFVLKYPEGCPLKQYQFERYFVLALVLLGNLAPHLPNDVKVLFQQNFRFLETLKVKHQKDDIKQMLEEAVNASTTNEIIMIICKIQRVHFRSMITFDFNNNCFKIVPPENFQSLPLFSKNDDDAKDLEKQRIKVEDAIN